jgi:hypothetical protein
MKPLCSNYIAFFRLVLRAVRNATRASAVLLSKRHIKQKSNIKEGSPNYDLVLCRDGGGATGCNIRPDFLPECPTVALRGIPTSTAAASGAPDQQ